MSSPTVGDAPTTYSGPYFDPGARLPPMLQSRLDSWKKDPPRSQFQQYGPLNAYLQGHKFPSKSFLVKPQALLRRLATQAQMEAFNKRAEKDEAVQSGKRKPRYSLDSHNDLVTGKKLYPDFDIDQCYTYGEVSFDVVRIVIEVGSLLDTTTQEELSRAQESAGVCLRKYLRVVGNRAHGRLLGIGIVGNTVCVVSLKSQGWMQRDLNISVLDMVWISLFDPRFIQALDDMLRFCKNDQPGDDADENHFLALTELVQDDGVESNNGEIGDEDAESDDDAESNNKAESNDDDTESDDGSDATENSNEDHMDIDDD